MRQVGIRGFKNQVTALINSGETLVIERRGKPVGFFVPIVAKDRRAGPAALGRLGKVVEAVLAETGLTEDQLVKELTRTRRR